MLKIWTGRVLGSVCLVLVVIPGRCGYLGAALGCLGQPQDFGAQSGQGQNNVGPIIDAPHSLTRLSSHNS